jgi:hypothetical protein
MKYKVYVRNWYKEITNQYGQKSLIPDPTARKTTLVYTNSEVEARETCKEYNEKHKPGPKSRKAEYTSNY